MTAVPDRLVTTTAERPDLVPTIAGWLWSEFRRHDGYTLEQTQAHAKQTALAVRTGPPQTFVLLANGRPIGTASLAAEDLDERPDLTPWLAGVFVIPGERGRGHAAHLIAAVESAARCAAIETMWLYTNTAERIYAKVGWRFVETVPRVGKRPVTLMRRDLLGHLPTR